MNIEADLDLSVQFFNEKCFRESEDVFSFRDRKRTEFSFKL